MNGQRPQAPPLLRQRFRERATVVGMAQRQVLKAHDETPPNAAR